MPYLLAAEADKIQDFIFRSSRLREVVGASQLLTRFCHSIEATLVRDYNGRVVVNDGGSFRVIFDKREDAIAFGHDLAEFYRLALGGSLTVAEPVELQGNFRQANEAASAKLRRAKSRRQGVVAEPHMPYVAFCASCGVALAQNHTRLANEGGGERRRYLCRDCQQKARESATNREEILNEFLYAVVDNAVQHDQYEFTYEPERCAFYDRRSYVAYLVADGNGMGALFGSIADEGTLSKFSEALSVNTRKSLAAPAKQLLDRLPKQPDRRSILPVLPLILGGDDLFALIPAPYALDVARRFCLTWEKQMDQLVKRHRLTGVPRPTIAAAVVICKSTYPYALAHRRAESLLKDAKRQSKLLATERGEYLSAVNFEVILGNRLAGVTDDNGSQSITLSLRPYWVASQPLSADAAERGLDLKQLLEQRLTLKDLPNKRLIELRRCFETVRKDVTIHERAQMLKEWTGHDLGRILSRLSQTEKSAVEKTLQSLGQPHNGDGYHWRKLYRGGSDVRGHGMLDLLEVWDFAQDLDHSLDEYEPQEAEA
ncbi:Cas10/Cmr2 second palm domain-containing protein [Roseiflexus sp.]|uniref:Cas10/Cmr2 second palm domain-containing protein n=1 Tax=Roseiflexus sp. TaxID=2562120 RepID=UPI00398AE236